MLGSWRIDKDMKDCQTSAVTAPTVNIDIQPVTSIQEKEQRRNAGAPTTAIFVGKQTP